MDAYEVCNYLTIAVISICHGSNYFRQCLILNIIGRLKIPVRVNFDEISK